MKNNQIYLPRSRRNLDRLFDVGRRRPFSFSSVMNIQIAKGLLIEEEEINARGDATENRDAFYI